MRWALSQVDIPCFGGIVPHKPNRASVEGTLLHELIQRFAYHMGKADEEVFRPRRILLGLIESWAEKNANNPRIDSIALARQVRIEEILRAFGEACSHVSIRSHQSNVGADWVNRKAVVSGVESWLRDPQSKLCGRADYVMAGEIVDFKSGERHDDHAEQIKFYGALYLALTGRAPSTLRLVYTATSESIDVPMPTTTELESLLQDMRRRTEAVEQQVVCGDLPAKPEPAKCMYCHVRGLCSEYWKFLVNRGQDKDCGQQAIVDYAPTDAATIEPAALGRYVRDRSFGGSSLLHLPRQIDEKVGERAVTLRILSLRIKNTEGSVCLTLTAGSEVYITDGG